MALSTATITYNVNDLFGADFVPDSATLGVRTNIPDDTVIDTAGNEIRVGPTGGKIPSGAGSTVVWVPGAGSNPETWQTSLDFTFYTFVTGPGGNYVRQRRTRTFGPFTITADADLADLVDEQEIPPTYLTQVTELLDEYVTEAQASATAASASAEAASDHSDAASGFADAAEVDADRAEQAAQDAVDISGISTSDDVVSNLVKNAGGGGPKTNEELEKSFPRRTSSLIRDVTSPAYGVEANGNHDDSDNFETFLNGLPDFDPDFGPAVNWDVANVPSFMVPPDGVIRLTRQMVCPPTKAVSMWTPAKHGARIQYEGAVTGTDGAMTAGSKTLTGSGFTAAMEGEDILVKGAGDNGATHVTWIQTYTNSTTVQLGHAALTTVGPTATYIRAFSWFRRGGVRSDKRGVPFKFSGLVFDGGGLVFNNATKPVVFEDCLFNETVGPGLLGLNKANSIGADANTGTGGVGFMLNRIMFNHCYGGYWHRAATAGLSHLEHIRFNGMKDIALVAPSGFHHGEDIDFQGVEVGVGDTMPSMWIPSDVDAGGRSYWNNLRWGSEIFTEGGVNFEPAYAGLVIGPLAGPAPSPGSSRPEEIKFGRVHFGGRADSAPSSTSAKNAIIINKMVDGISIREGKFFKYAGPLIQENWVTVANGSNVRDQVLANNWFDPSVNVSPAHTAGIFSHNGVDWRPQPIAQTFIAGTHGQRRQNLVPRSNQFNHADWAKTRCSVAQDITGPDGVVAAYTMTRTSAGFAHMEQIITGFTAGEPLTLAIEAKAGTHDQIAFGLNATIGGETQQLCDYLRPVKLGSRWDRYWVMHPRIPTGTTSLELRIYHDVGNSVLTGGTVLLCQAQLEHAYEPGLYMNNNSATVVASLPLGGHAVGGVRQSSGSAAPTTGRHDAGEVVWNNAPTAGGTVGWVCVTNGSPGTWKTFGTIAS